jgi:hypothetical protein
MKMRLQTEVLPREARLFVQIFVWLELADTKLEMVGAEINESGAVSPSNVFFRPSSVSKTVSTPSNIPSSKQSPHCMRPKKMARQPADLSVTNSATR